MPAFQCSKQIRVEVLTFSEVFHMKTAQHWQNHYISLHKCLHKPVSTGIRYCTVWPYPYHKFHHSYIMFPSEMLRLYKFAFMFINTCMLCLFRCFLLLRCCVSFMLDLLLVVMTVGLCILWGTPQSSPMGLLSSPTTGCISHQPSGLWVAIKYLCTNLWL